MAAVSAYTMPTHALSIPPGREDDCQVVERVANALNEHDGLPAIPVVGWVRRDVFGAEPRFELLVAERAGEILGYALHGQAYNTDYGTVGLWLEDLYVRADERRSGVGRRL